MAKIKLSETIHFQPVTEILTHASSFTEPTLKISLNPGSVAPGRTISAHANLYIHTDNTDIPSFPLDYLAVSLEGQIMVNDNPTSFVHAAEIEHGRTVPNQTHFVLSFSIRIPDDAITSNSGGKWMLSARAVSQNTHIIQDQVPLNLTHSNEPETHS